MKVVMTYELYSAGKHCKHARLFKHIQKMDTCGNSSCDYRCEVCALTRSDLQKVYHEWYAFVRMQGPRTVECGEMFGAKMIRMERIWER